MPKNKKGNAEQNAPRKASTGNVQRWFADINTYLKNQYYFMTDNTIF
jgi:hypothetical protein